MAESRDGEFLRELAKQGNGVSIDYDGHMVEVYLAVLKYGIDDVQNKSIIRLRFERILNKHKVNEIPGLIDALGLHSGKRAGQ